MKRGFCGSPIIDDKFRFLPMHVGHNTAPGVKKESCTPTMENKQNGYVGCFGYGARITEQRKNVIYGIIGYDNYNGEERIPNEGDESWVKHDEFAKKYGIFVLPNDNDDKKQQNDVSKKKQLQNEHETKYAWDDEKGDGKKNDHQQQGRSKKDPSHKHGHNGNPQSQHHDQGQIHPKRHLRHDKNGQETHGDDDGYHLMDNNGQMVHVSRVFDPNRGRSSSTQVQTGDMSHLNDNLAKQEMDNLYYDYDMDYYEDAYDFAYKHQRDRRIITDLMCWNY